MFCCVTILNVGAPARPRPRARAGAFFIASTVQEFRSLTFLMLVRLAVSLNITLTKVVNEVDKCGVTVGFYVLPSACLSSSNWARNLRQIGC